MTRMLNVIHEFGSRTQREQAYRYEAQGNTVRVETIYRKVMGQ